MPNTGRAPVPGEASFHRTAWTLTLGVTALLAILLGRVVQLQVFPSAQLRERMLPRVSTRPELPRRGDLLDRRGRTIATTRFAHRLVIDPTTFGTQPDVDTAIMRLSQSAGLDPASLGGRVHWAMEENVRRAAVAAAWTPLAVSSPSPAPDIAATSAPEATDPFAPSPDHAEVGASSTTGSADGVQDALDGPPGPIRYLAVSELLNDDQEAAVRACLRAAAGQRRIVGVTLERVPERKFAAGDEVAALVGKVGFGHVGLAGAEYRMNEDLSGAAGSVTFLRDRSGRPLWIESGAIDDPTPGQDVRLSIDLELQRIAHEELSRQIELHHAAGGRLVMIDPGTGEVLAMVDIVRDPPEAVPFPWPDAPQGLKRGQRAPPAPEVSAKQRYLTIKPDPGRRIHPALARTRCVEDIYEPGSTFKPFVWSTITELGRASLTEVFDTENGKWFTSYGRYIEDVTKRDHMTWQEVLINSSNIGMIKGAERLTAQELHDLVRRFGFGERTNIGLPGESSGRVTPMAKWSKYTQTSVAHGYEVAVTPLQMARAFSAFARTGERAGTLPTLRLTAVDTDEGTPVNFRVLPAPIAELTRQAMQSVVNVMDTRWTKPPDGAWRFTMFGKSGTAKIPLGAPPPGKRMPRGTNGYFPDAFVSSFIAGAPADNPRLVCVALLDDPQALSGHDRKSRYGSAAAGPLVRRVMERSLMYLGAAGTPAVEGSGPMASVN